MNNNNHNLSQHQQSVVITSIDLPTLSPPQPPVVKMNDNTRSVQKLSATSGSRLTRSSTAKPPATNQPSTTMIGTHSNPFSGVIAHLNHPPTDPAVRGPPTSLPITDTTATTTAPTNPNPYIRSGATRVSMPVTQASAVTSPVTTVVYHTSTRNDPTPTTTTPPIDSATSPTIAVPASTTTTNPAPTETQPTLIVDPSPSPSVTTNNASVPGPSTRTRTVNSFTRYRGPDILTTGPNPNDMDIDTPLPPRVANPADRYVGPAAAPPILPLPRRAVYGRYTWKIQVPASESPIDAFATAVQEIWSVLLGSDPSLVIYPWAERDAMDASQALTDPATCPRTMHEIHAYFQRPFLSPEGRTLYLPVRLGHALSVAELRQSTSHFFGLAVNKFRVGFWYQALQHEKVVEVGWLLGSTAFMSPERLALEIESRSNGAIQVGCRWKMIALRKYNKDLPKHLQHRAMHIEVRYEQESAALRYLGDLFSSNRTSDFVMGTPMRLIPIISKTTGENMAKCSKMRACQGTFTAECRSVRIYTIPSLDFRHPTADHFSVRDFLLDVKVPSRPQERLFLSCDHQQDESVVLTFFNRHQEAAYMVAQNPLAFLRFTNLPRYAAGITSCFTPEERERAENCSWDPTSRMVITLADSQLAAITDDAVDDLFGFDPEVHQRIQLEMDAVTNSTLNSGQLESGGIIRTHGGDSVSTFRKRTRFDDDHSTGSASTPQASTAPPPSKRPSPTVNRSTTTRRPAMVRGDTSTHSDVTMETRMSSMEQNFLMFQESLMRIEQRLASTPSQGDSGAGRPL